MEDITKELNSATEYLRAMKKSGHHKDDCDNMLMHLANIEDLVNKLFIAIVSNCNEKKGSEFEDWLKKQNLKEVVTKEYKWREFVLDEEFVLAKFNEDKHR